MWWGQARISLFCCWIARAKEYDRFLKDREPSQNPKRYKRHICCDTLSLHFKALFFFLARHHALGTICFIDFLVEHLVLFWPSFVSLHFVFSDTDLSWNSCDLRIQTLDLSYFKSVVAQQEYSNVSCLQQWMEQFSVTHVPDSLHCTCASRFL